MSVIFFHASFEHKHMNTCFTFITKEINPSTALTLAIHIHNHIQAHADTKSPPGPCRSTHVIGVTDKQATNWVSSSRNDQTCANKTASVGGTYYSRTTDWEFPIHTIMA